MFSELPQVADIVRSAFDHLANPLVLRITAFWVRAIPCSAVAQERHKIIHNRVALAGEESVSGVTGGSGPPDQPGEPTHAHLHHRQ